MNRIDENAAQAINNANKILPPLPLKREYICPANKNKNNNEASPIKIGANQ
jgi:hypothetical protein